MEVIKMNIKGKKNSVLCICFAVLVLMTSPVYAQWPTLDVTAIKESISSKVELVKQSKIVTETTQLAGKMNSAIGDATGTMSKFAGDNLQKIKEQAKKLEDQKKRLEKNKKKLEKAKEKAAKAKEKMEKAQEKINEAKQTINEAKEFADDAKSKVDEAKQVASDIKEVAGDAAATTQNAVSSVQNKVNDVSSQVGISSDQSPTSNFVDDYVADYEASINSDSKVYELPNNNYTNNGKDTLTMTPLNNVQTIENKAESGGINTKEPEGTQNITNNIQKTGTDEEKQVASDVKEVAGDAAATTQNAVSSVQNEVNDVSSQVGISSDQSLTSNLADENVADYEASINSDSEVSELPNNNDTNNGKDTLTTTPLNNVQAIENKAESGGINTKESERTQNTTNTGYRKPFTVKQKRQFMRKGKVQETGTENVQTNKNSQSFRQKSVIKSNETQVDKEAWLKTSKPITVASYQMSSTLMFGAEDAGSEEDYIPDGVINNGQYDETIIPESLVWYCKIGVDKLEDPTVMENCVKELIRHQSDDDNQVAEEGKSVTQKVTGEGIVAAAAESMLNKVSAANYEEEVLNKFEEQAGSASTSRDDSSVLALTNKEIQILLNKLITIAATQLSLDAMNQISSLTKENLGENESEDSDEEDSDGNEDQGA